MDDLHLQVIEWVPFSGGGGGVVYAVEALDDLFSEEFRDERIPERTISDDEEHIEIR